MLISLSLMNRKRIKYFAKLSNEREYLVLSQQVAQLAVVALFV